MAYLPRGRGSRLQDVGGGLVRELSADFACDLPTEVTELGLELDLARLALPRHRLGAARRAVQPRSEVPGVRGGNVLGWDVRVVDGGEATGSVVGTEGAP